MSRREIVVDHDEIRTYVLGLRAVADDIETTIASQTTALMADLRDEAGQGTRDGRPAPIFLDTLTAMQVACDALVTNSVQLVKNIRADADYLEHASREAQRVDDEGGEAVERVGVGFAAGGLQRDGIAYGTIPSGHQRDGIWLPYGS